MFSRCGLVGVGRVSAALLRMRFGADPLSLATAALGSRAGADLIRPGPGLLPGPGL
jgi:hypothetical protein